MARTADERKLANTAYARKSRKRKTDALMSLQHQVDMYKQRLCELEQENLLLRQTVSSMSRSGGNPNTLQSGVTPDKVESISSTLNTCSLAKRQKVKTNDIDTADTSSASSAQQTSSENSNFRPMQAGDEFTFNEYFGLEDIPAATAGSSPLLTSSTKVPATTVAGPVDIVHPPTMNMAAQLVGTGCAAPNILGVATAAPTIHAAKACTNPSTETNAADKTRGTTETKSKTQQLAQSILQKCSTYTGWMNLPTHEQLTAAADGLAPLDIPAASRAILQQMELDRGIGLRAQGQLIAAAPMIHTAYTNPSIKTSVVDKTRIATELTPNTKPEVVAALTIHAAKVTCTNPSTDTNAVDKIKAPLEATTTIQSIIQKCSTYTGWMNLPTHEQLTAAADGLAPLDIPAASRAILQQMELDRGISLRAQGQLIAAAPMSHAADITCTNPTLHSKPQLDVPTLHPNVQTLTPVVKSLDGIDVKSPPIDFDFTNFFDFEGLDQVSQNIVTAQDG